MGGGIFSCLGVVLVCFLALGVYCYIGCSFDSEKELEVEKGGGNNLERPGRGDECDQNII